jgi:phosphatidylserine/phosphatidylglycerophosphate/cardiolipin synthase-like enzyme
MSRAFKIQFVRIVVQRQGEDWSHRNHWIFLDVKSESESKETFKIGPLCFSEDRDEALSGLCYVAASPVRVRVFSQSLLLQSDLGVQMLYDHLHLVGTHAQRGCLVFGARGGMPVIKIFFRVSPVTLSFRVDLREVRCLKQAASRLPCLTSAWSGGKEHLTARVGVATFDLGSFRLYDSVAPEGCTLYVQSRTTAVFMVDGKQVGKVEFVPWDEDPNFVNAKESTATTTTTMKDSSSSSSSGGKLLVFVDGELGDSNVVTLGGRYSLNFSVLATPVELKPTTPVAGASLLSIGESFPGNRVEILVDGLQTFERYFYSMMQAKHSISILAWELSLSFGLITCERGAHLRPHTTPANARWISLEDVLLAKALKGVTIRIIVWRHQLLTYLNRFLYLGEVTIEAEVNKLINRGKALGVTVRMVRATSSKMDAPYYSNPHVASGEASIVIVIVGNPRGVLSSHHEKLLLIDAECSGDHGTAFIGGFDIARGRYDQPLHQIPKPYFELYPPQQSAPRYTGPEVQPVLRRIRFLWHDVQVMLQGPIVQSMHLHFAQRWIYAFSSNVEEVRGHVLPPRKPLCDVPATSSQKSKKKGQNGGPTTATKSAAASTSSQQSAPSSTSTSSTSSSSPSSSSKSGAGGTSPSSLQSASGGSGLATVQLVRCWRGVLDVQMMFELHRRMIRRAKKFLFIEHQYPFHNWGLTYDMCEALRSNPDLKAVREKRQG